ncbi:MAG: nuclear transport factor 2 family protein [Gemmatimonadales bacterium]|nr:nuclear transport factor 2 family protein [Gemmatimonadales bacterium]
MSGKMVIQLITLAVLVVGAGAVMAGEDDHAAIESTVRDYVDGWYAGDAARIERALHPDLAKRVVRTLPDGTEYLDTASASNMVAYTAVGFGKGKLPEGYVNQVTILETTGKIAMAKSVSPEFIDYIHLAKTTEGWKIVNVLWEPVEQ